MRLITLCAIPMGIFPRLYSQSLQATLTSELQYDLNNMVNTCNLLRFDAETVIAPGGSLDIATLHFLKARPESIAGDWQTFSNIEEDNLPASIAIAGYTQSIGNSKIFVGVRNLNEDYFTSPITSMFTNSSCGIFPTLSVSLPVANYPVSAMCVDYKGELGKFNIEASLYNGQAYKGWKRGDNPLIINPRRDGIFAITQLNYQTTHGKYFGGYALHNRMPFYYDPGEPGFEEEKQTKTGTKRVRHVWWAYAEQSLLRRRKNKLDVILQYSQTSGSNMECDSYAALGLMWSHGTMHKLAVITNRAGFEYGWETATEITYCFDIKENMFIQPALHIICNNEGINKLLMMRFGYKFKSRR